MPPGMTNAGLWSAQPGKQKGKVMQTSSQQEMVQLISLLAEGKVFPLQKARSAMIRWALVSTHGNVSQAASLLGTSRGTVYRYARA